MSINTCVGPELAAAGACWPAAVSRLAGLGRGAWVAPNLLNPLHAPADDFRRSSRLPPPVAAAAVAAEAARPARVWAEVEQFATSAVRRRLRSSICRAPQANVTLRCALGRSPSLRARNCKSASAHLTTDG
jgi:hypothetical protein